MTGTQDAAQAPAPEARRGIFTRESAEMIRTPVVRNGKQATVGYCPDVWKTWQ